MRKIIISESQYERLFKTNDAAFLVSKDLKYLVYENELFDIVNKKSLGDYRKSNLIKEDWGAEDWIDLGVGGLSTVLDLAGGATSGATSVVAKIIDFFHSISFIWRGVSRNNDWYKIAGFIGLASIVFPLMGSGAKTTLITLIRPLMNKTPQAIFKVLKNNKIGRKLMEVLSSGMSKIRNLGLKFDKWAVEYEWFATIWKPLKKVWGKTVEWFDDVLKQSKGVKPPKTAAMGYGGKTLKGIVTRLTAQQLAKWKALRPAIELMKKSVNWAANLPGFKVFLKGMWDVLPPHILQLSNPLALMQAALRFFHKGLSWARKGKEVPASYVPLLKFWDVTWRGKSASSKIGEISKFIKAYGGISWSAAWLNHILCATGIKNSTKKYDREVSNVLIPEQDGGDPVITGVGGLIGVAWDLLLFIGGFLKDVVTWPFDLFKDCATKKGMMDKLFQVTTNVMGSLGVDSKTIPSVVDLGSGNGSDVTSWTN